LPQAAQASTRLKTKKEADTGFLFLLLPPQHYTMMPMLPDADAAKSD
jgi:hypothetical protein